MTQIYLTRRQVAELYPISEHTLAALASRGMGPPFFKPTDKVLYRSQDVEAWIEAAIVTPIGPVAPSVGQPRKGKATAGGRGRAIPKPSPFAISHAGLHGRKSLPPSPNSALRRSEQARAGQGDSEDV
ncbi:MAG TPA: helix-turn-helix domain-containing protein [Devosia sp.]|nr:helix-turn-helix domain-containing protein [Devosia sp.]